MTVLTTASLRGMLEDAWDAAPAGALTLRQQLRSSEKACRELTSAGSLSSVGKNSANQAYAFAGRGTATTLEIADGWRKLVDLFDTVSAALTSVSTTADDDTIYPEMMARLAVNPSYRHDFSQLRGCA